jgi:hypothetical protein
MPRLLSRVFGYVSIIVNGKVAEEAASLIYRHCHPKDLLGIHDDVKAGVCQFWAADMCMRLPASPLHNPHWY